MRLLNHARKLLRRLSRTKRNERKRQARNELRRCLFESMEPRQLLAAVPLVVGAVYVEEDLGSDAHGDTFQVTFQGGAADTELTRLTITTDQNQPGFSVGDVFFDVDTAGLGADESLPFTLVKMESADPSANVTVRVSDGGTELVLDLNGFRSGDRLIFQIDVDEVEYLDPLQTDIESINDGFDPITSGIEFQGSQFQAEFSAAHYHDAQAHAVFWNRYDDHLQGTGLNLPEDDARGKRDRSAGAVGSLVQRPLPVALAGTVYLDNDLNLVQGSTDAALNGVTLELWQKSGDAYRFTGSTATTDAAGAYRFSTDLDLQPGVYQIREQQPAGLFSVGAIPGRIGKDAIGSPLPGNPDVLTEIEIPLGGLEALDLDFAEAEPASLSGYVIHDRNNDGHRDPGEEGIPGVSLRIEPLATIAAQEVLTVTTDANGAYSADGLAPGSYRITEIQQPLGYQDGIDAPGTVSGRIVGFAVNPGDEIRGIELAGGQQGVEYDFAEWKHASIEGNVHLSGPDGDCYTPDPSQPPLADVRVDLLDDRGRLLQTTTTDPQGRYIFEDLLPGNYTVVEHTPTGLIDGGQRVGTIDGRTVGHVSGEDTISEILVTSGQRALDYDFCEQVPASLAGTVFHDLDNNGRRDSGEPAISGIRIELRDTRGSLVDAAITNAIGDYEFKGLRAGDYTLHEIQPQGYEDGTDRAGRIGGTVNGHAVNPGDQIRDITLRWGDAGVDYDFAEWKHASIEGTVYLSGPDGDCYTPDQSQPPLADVRVDLLDDRGRLLRTTSTDQQGHYIFEDLLPGNYTVVEHTPAGLIDGGQQIGTIDGRTVGRVSGEDTISEIVVTSGQIAENYNFCEHVPASLAGSVFHDLDNDGRREFGEPAISGVRIELRDARGNLVDAATTNANGDYEFKDLRAGDYALHETQPQGYEDGTDRAGRIGGTVNGRAVNPGDQIRDITLRWGDAGIDYDFAEIVPATLSGYVFQDGAPLKTRSGQPPRDYRDQRDGVRTDDDTPLAGVVLELRDGVTGLPVTGDQAMPGEYGEGPIRTVTDADGYYEFRGLLSANYAVFQVQPKGYVDGNDTPGTAQGTAFNVDEEINSQIVAQLLVAHGYDAIVGIALSAGQASEHNNFSEVLVQGETIIIVIPDPTPAPPDAPLPAPPAPETPFYFAPPVKPARTEIYGAAGALNFSWHLSVIDAGMPRGPSRLSLKNSVWRMTGFLEPEDWHTRPMDQGRWLLRSGIGAEASIQSRDFGTGGGVPIAADWNGDGIDELAIYVKGFWYVDLNGNGIWDEEDLWAKLGTDMDVPVTGDWNGDGKDDIGIFGPAWSGDPRAMMVEVGLPDLRNRVEPVTKPKNVPPRPEEATDGVRVMRHTPRGSTRADVIDHVFKYGNGRHTPVTGDWSGDGIKNIGIFRDGVWQLDIDGDGRWSEGDRMVEFGQPGDLPVVGDFNGDGIAEIAVFRAGTWIIDINGNQQLDAHDQVFAFGQPGDLPATGDWNGDGIDDPAVYREK